MSREEIYEYRSIKLSRTLSEICLSIHGPSTFFGAGSYCAMFGGCGVGRAKTRQDAEKLLSEYAKETLKTRIFNAEYEARVLKERLGSFKLQRK